MISRPYTPVSGDELVGFVELLVKCYAPCARFPKGGAMSARFEALRVGDCLDFRGPKGHVRYLGGGALRVGRGYRGPGAGARVERVLRARAVGMVCGGSGVTPMLQVLEWAHRHEPAADVSWSLLAANQTPADVLCRRRLDALARAWPRLHRWYTVDRARCGGGGDVGGGAWAFSTGFVDVQMLRARLPAAGEDTVVLLCGPPAMIERACLPALKELGHKECNILVF
eukprot:g802.t1